MNPVTCMATRIAQLAKQPHHALIQAIIQTEFPTQAHTISDWKQHVGHIIHNHTITKRELSPSAQVNNAPKQKRAKIARPFDFWSYPQRHIALKFTYNGTDFHGYASQPIRSIDPNGRTISKATEPVPTVEATLFDVLKRCKLIENESICRSQRCGRTDKGVHAADQTVSLWLRSKVKHGLGCLPDDIIQHRHDDDIEERIVIAAEAERKQMSEMTDNKPSEDEEFDYVTMLNKLLPPSIRVTSYTPVPLDFSSRHSCVRRVYHYVFFDDGMNFVAMREAAALMEGSYDFRNFCKIDPVNVAHFFRTIRSVRIEPFHSVQFENKPERVISGVDSMHVLIIEGIGFLYHQVRCMASVLFSVGRGEEKPEVVSKLLDIEQVKSRPAYNMASEKQLALYSTGYRPPFDSMDQWFHPTPQLARDSRLAVLKNLHHQWRTHTVQAAVTEKLMEQVKTQIEHVERVHGFEPVKLTERWPFQLDLHRAQHADGGGIRRKLDGQHPVRLSIVDERNDARHDSFEDAVAKLNPKQKKRREENIRLRLEWERRQQALIDQGVDVQADPKASLPQPPVLQSSDDEESTA